MIGANLTRSHRKGSPYGKFDLATSWLVSDAVDTHRNQKISRCSMEAIVLLKHDGAIAYRYQRTDHPLAPIQVEVAFAPTSYDTLTEHFVLRPRLSGIVLDW